MTMTLTDSLDHTHERDRGCESCQNHSSDQHDHDHNYDHHHRDHAHSPAESFVESALIISRKDDISFSVSLSAEEALKRIAAVLAKIGEQVALDGFVAGHIKVLMECSAGKTTLSVTRTDVVDAVKHDEWEGAIPLTSCTLSTNILTLRGEKATLEAMINDGLLYIASAPTESPFASARFLHGQ